MLDDRLGTRLDQLGQAGFGIALLHGQPFVLAQVVCPGIDDVSLNEPVRRRLVAKQLPLICTTAPPQSLKGTRGFDELLHILGWHSVLQRDENGAVLGGWLADKRRFRPVKRRREIRRTGAQSKPSSPRQAPSQHRGSADDEGDSQRRPFRERPQATLPRAIAP